MNRTTTFSKGSACYSCRTCSRMTRDDGCGDSVGCGLCTQCYELAGYENTISDNGIEAVDARDVSSIRASLAIISARGGNASVWDELLESLGAAPAAAVSVDSIPVVELAAPAGLRKFEVRADFGTSIISYIVEADSYNGAKKAGRAAHRATGARRDAAKFTAYLAKAA